MECVYDKNTECGNFKTLDEYYKWDGPAFCERICNTREATLNTRRRRDAHERSHAHNQRYPKGEMYRSLKKKRLPVYMYRESGRRVAPWPWKKR